MLYNPALFLFLLCVYLLSFRLREIDMSEYDAATYERFSNAVQRQVQSLRIILESLQVNSIQFADYLANNLCFSLLMYMFCK